MRRVLIPFDGSAAAMRGVQYVARLATAMTEPPHTVLLSVVLPAGFTDEALQGKSREIALEDARESQKPAAAALGKAGVTCESHVEAGSPAELIDQYGQAHHCDMIVMGTRGLGAVGGLLLGSVANKTVHLTTLPVMLVK